MKMLKKDNKKFYSHTVFYNNMVAWLPDYFQWLIAHVKAFCESWCTITIVQIDYYDIIERIKILYCVIQPSTFTTTVYYDLYCL